MAFKKMDKIINIANLVLEIEKNNHGRLQIQPNPRAVFSVYMQKSFKFG